MDIGVLRNVSNINVFHIIIEHKSQYDEGQIIKYPFDNPRDLSHWPEYKQKAEGLLEEERKKNCPDYPSRLDCLFVAEDKEDVWNWVRNKYRQGSVFFLYELIITEGHLIYLDTDWYEGLCELFLEGTPPITHNKSKDECIENYWKSNVMGNEESCLKEGLFYGEIKVLTKTKYKYDKCKNTILPINS